jgi:hypothetical protein
VTVVPGVERGLCSILCAMVVAVSTPAIEGESVPPLRYPVVAAARVEASENPHVELREPDWAFTLNTSYAVTGVGSAWVPPVAGRRWLTVPPVRRGRIFSPPL